MRLEARELAVFVQRAFFWHTPYRTGNLARSVGDVGYRGAGEAGFTPFSMTAAPYGKLLNDYPVINGRRVLQNGTVREWSYANQHYDWISKGVDKCVDSLVASIGGAYRE